MKHLLMILAVGLSLIASAQTKHDVDAGKSKVTWIGRKVTGQHTGGISVKSGTITWNGQGLVSADIVIDMTTITDTDMEPETAARLVAHLNSPDFFNTAEFKTATFKSTAVEKIANAAPGKPNYKVTGDLTIKGITHPVTFDVLATKEGKMLHATAELSFDRTKYNVKFRSGQFFEGLGDKMIEDQVGLKFELTTK